MFEDADQEVGGALARANMMITTTITAFPSHQIRPVVERPNGRDLSGRNSASHIPLQETTFRISLTSDRESPVRFSEWLAHLPIADGEDCGTV